MKTVAIASATRSVPSGKSETIRLSLNAAGQRLLRRSKRGLRTKVVVTLGETTAKTRIVRVEKTATKRSKT